MKMNRRKAIRGTFAIVALGALALTGCAKNDGNEFLGSWLEKGQRTTTMEIERNSDGFLMKTTSVNRRGQQNTGSVPATMKDGTLNFPNGPVTGTVTYVKAQDELIVSSFAGNFTFSRFK
jgi:hypothetical protein